MRLVEIRLLEGPNLYRDDPTLKVEVSVGRHGRWGGTRDPAGRRVARLGAIAPARTWPDEVALLVAWARRLRVAGGEGVGGVAVHRASDPGHWVVTFPWHASDRARAIAEAAVDLASRDVSAARRARLTGTQDRLLARHLARISEASGRPPAWIRDADRQVPVVSISGTNGKSTVTRLITHVLRLAGRRVGTTTSDGVYVDERLVDAGDWTGPGGAALVLGRDDVDVAVLETARGGILLRGVGYESNEASVLTNISADHLDLQGIHTLAELAEVKATIARITRRDGWVVLNADDPHVASLARRVRAGVALFSLDGSRSEPFRRHVASGGPGWTVHEGALVRVAGREVATVLDIADMPLAIGGLARYNVANALAAGAAAHAMGASLEHVAAGLADFRPTADLSPGRMNLFRLGGRLVIVDFAHNEAGVEAVLDVAEGLAAASGGSGPGGRGSAPDDRGSSPGDRGSATEARAPVTLILGTAGDRPDDTLRGIGRIAAARADRVVIKETLAYLRGRDREDVIEQLRRGIDDGGGSGETTACYASETAALAAELARAEGGGAEGGGADGDAVAPSPGTWPPPSGSWRPSSVIVLMCHDEREGVFALLAGLGAEPVVPGRGTWAPGD